MKSILCALLIFFSTASLFAGTITVMDDASTQLMSIQSAHSRFRPIQFCTAGRCELIPSQNILALQEFSDRDLDWGQIFNQCKNYRSLNQLTTWTQIISSLIVGLKPISALRNIRSTKNLLASWGLFGRVVGHRIVFDTGITVAGQVVYSIPTQLVENEEPYPEVSPDDVRLVSNLIEDVLNDNEATFFLPTELIQGLVVILKGCTSQLKQEYISSNARSCLAHCHSSKPDNAASRTRSKTLRDPSLTSPVPRMELHKEELQDYLK